MENATIVETMKRQPETVKITLELPLGMAQFFRDLQEIPLAIESQSLEDFAKDAAFMQFESLLNSLPWTMFSVESINKYYGMKQWAHSRLSQRGSS